MSTSSSKISLGSHILHAFFDLGLWGIPSKPFLTLTVGHRRSVRLGRHAAPPLGARVYAPAQAARHRSPQVLLRRRRRSESSRPARHPDPGWRAFRQGHAYSEAYAT